MTLDYFYGQAGELFSFYRIPKALFQEPRFQSLSTDAKTLYGILLDRMSLSVKNGWLDEQNRVFIIFTIEDVKRALCCADNKATKLLRELEKFGLIERKRRGLGKPSLVYTDCGQRRVYLRLYSGTLRLRDTVALAGREKLKITEMRIPSKGEIVRTDTAYQGEIVILPSDSVRLNDVLGDQTRLPRKRWREDPLPMLRTTIAPKTAAQRERLLDALTQLADTDPLLRCEVDSITHEIILSFLGRVQLEVVSALLSEKYKLETVVKEPTVIYMERPLKAASHTIHIEVPPNPFWASIGLSVTPLPLGSGVQYESRVSLGYLNQSFQNAVRDGIRYGLEQGLFGWNVTDCKICFEYGLYYSPVSTPADFRSLAPIVLEQALKESGTQLLEPYLSFILYAPQEYLSRAYHDAPKYCATIETAQVKKDEVVFTGEIPARCIQAYRTDLAFYTNGRSVCLTELKGYQAAVGQPVIQPRRPNSRLDKVRHMFQKVM